MHLNRKRGAVSKSPCIKSGVKMLKMISIYTCLLLLTKSRPHISLCTYLLDNIVDIVALNHLQAIKSLCATKADSLASDV